MTRAPESRRSVLFTPGDQEARMLEALMLGADTVCFDLEDAVAPESKEVARQAIARVLEKDSSTQDGPEMCVRINALQGDEWRSDLEVVMRARPAAVMVPKAEDPAALTRLGIEMGEAESAAGVHPGSTRLLLLVETALGVLKAHDCGLAVSQRLGGLLFGAERLATDAGLTRTRTSVEVLYARSHVALAAAALGVGAIDQVYVDVRDVAGLETEARIGRALGYTGKMAIHHDQLAPIHRAFTPTSLEVDRARRLLLAAQQASGGVFRFEGKTIDQQLLTQAERIVRLAQRAARTAL